MKGRKKLKADSVTILSCSDSIVFSTSTNVNYNGNLGNKALEKQKPKEEKEIQENWKPLECSLVLVPN